ncbi:MAG: hypothetical protein NZ921_04005 [Candidatus Caldarchaeum sp.]|nr:hypothetical protein [Candidatus Caldarchaeum sp.]
MTLKRFLSPVLGVVVAVLLFSGVYFIEFSADAGEPRIEALAVTPQMPLKTAEAPDLVVTGLVWLGSLSVALVVLGFARYLVMRRFS